MILGDLMLKIVLRILDIFLYLLKIWFFIFQKVIMIMYLILNIIFQLVLYSILENDEKIPFSLFINRKNI